MRAKILNARSTIFTPSIPLTPRAARGINISQEIVDPSGTRCKPHKPHNGKRFEVIVKLETALRTSTDTLLENHNNRHVSQTARLLATTAPGRPLLRSRLPFGVNLDRIGLPVSCPLYTLLATELRSSLVVRFVPFATIRTAVIQYALTTCPDPKRVRLEAWLRWLTASGAVEILVRSRQRSLKMNTQRVNCISQIIWVAGLSV